MKLFFVISVHFNLPVLQGFGFIIIKQVENSHLGNGLVCKNTSIRQAQMLYTHTLQTEPEYSFSFQLPILELLQVKYFYNKVFCFKTYTYKTSCKLYSIKDNCLLP